MKGFNFCGRFLATTVLFFSFSFGNSSWVLMNENILNDKVVEKINEMGKELKEKTNINVYVLVISSLKNQSLNVFLDEMNKSLNQPHVILFLSKEDKKLEIISSKEVENYFDKESVLSPYPWKGSIIPLLTSKKGTDNYNAGLLNGYADIVEQIAQSKKIILDSAIGNTNRTILRTIKFFIYSTIGFVIVYFVYRRLRKYGKKEKI